MVELLRQKFNINNNIDIDNTDSKTNNIIKEQENKSNIEEENTLTENGRIIKAKILPTGFNENSRALKQFTLVGRDKGADATVSFKGDEKNFAYWF